MVALRWNPQGKRKQGRPKATWRRTVEKEIKAMGLTWGEAEMVALDRFGSSRQNWLEAEIGGLMLRAELRAIRREDTYIANKSQKISLKQIISSIIRSYVNMKALKT